MRTNSENARIYEPRISGLRYANVVLVISATQVIPNDGPGVWVLDGGLADRTVRLPLLSYDKHVMVANVGASNNLNVTDSAGNAVVTVAPLYAALFFGAQTRWIYFLTDRNDPVTTTSVIASGNLLATDIEVHVNGAGAVVLTLPNSNTWKASSGGRGLPLSVFDISGNAATNNITINSAAGQTFSGLASLTISNNFDGYRLRPITGGGWLVV